MSYLAAIRQAGLAIPSQDIGEQASQKPAGIIKLRKIPQLTKKVMTEPRFFDEIVAKEINTMAKGDTTKRQMRDAANKAKWDRFAMEYAKDLQPGPAYLRAGYRTSQRNARTSAHRLLSTNAYVQKKVAELLAQQKAVAKMEADDIVRALEQIATTPITEFLTAGPRSLKLKDLSKIPPERLLALQSIRVTSGKKGDTVSIRLRDSVRACQMLGQRFGLWDKDDAPQQVNVNVISYADAMTQKELEQSQTSGANKAEGVDET